MRLRNNKNVKGLNVKLDGKSHSIKVFQLADDRTLFCKDKHDVVTAMNEIEIFGSFSGLLLNRNKTEGLWIRKFKSCKDKIVGIKWRDKPIKALGVFSGRDKEECQKLNWNCKIENMNKSFVIWKKNQF